MNKRVFTYDKAIIYLGDLDKEALAEVVNDVLNNLPASIVRLTRNEEVLIYSFDNNNILTITLGFYIIKDVLTPSEVAECSANIVTSLAEAIKRELKSQKLIFTLD